VSLPQAQSSATCVGYLDKLGDRGPAFLQTCTCHAHRVDQDRLTSVVQQRTLQGSAAGSFSPLTASCTMRTPTATRVPSTTLTWRKPLRLTVL